MYSKDIDLNSRLWVISVDVVSSSVLIIQAASHKSENGRTIEMCSIELKWHYCGKK